MTNEETGARKPLNRERALQAAVELADASGLESVSMRNLAEVLGVVPMALYRHVANKQDLLSGMVDVIISTYDPPDAGTDWKTTVRNRILSARRVMLEHPWARQVIESRRQRTPAVLAYMDSLTGAFIGGGFTPDLAHHAMHALGYRIWGFSPEAFEDPDAFPVPDDPAEREAMIEQVAAVYPNIVAIALDAAGGNIASIGRSCDEQYEFEFALDLLLDAFEQLHLSGWRSEPLTER